MYSFVHPFNLLQRCNISYKNFIEYCFRNLCRQFNKDLHKLHLIINDKNWKYNLQLKNRQDKLAK